MERLGLGHTVTSDVNIIKQRLKYTSEAIVQSNTGDWYAIRSYSAANLKVAVSPEHRPIDSQLRSQGRPRLHE